MDFPGNMALKGMSFSGHIASTAKSSKDSTSATLAATAQHDEASL